MVNDKKETRNTALSTGLDDKISTIPSNLENIDLKAGTTNTNELNDSINGTILNDED